MTYADSAIKRMKEYASAEFAYLRREGDLSINFEPLHPLLNRPRLVVQCPGDISLDELYHYMLSNGWGHHYNEFVERTKPSR